MSGNIKFIHAADLHLGKTLYGIKQRYNDFFKAFEWLLNKAIYEEVNFVLISGDLIDSERKVNPSTLGNIITTIKDFQSKCEESLKRKIPIICIEGNHETPFFSDRTWLKLLADLELIILLSGKYDKAANRIIFEDYSYREHRGGKIQIGNTTIYGISYFGSSTPNLYPLIEKEIDEEEKFVILMMHFGIQGEDKRKKGYPLTKSLQELHDKVDYLALGHFHIQYEKPENNPWIFNPGSLEVNEITELGDDRGIYLVNIFPEDNFNFTAQPILCENGSTDNRFSIPNRRFLTYSSINITESQSFEEAQEMVISRLRKLGVPEKTGDETNLSNLDIPVLYIFIKGWIEYSELEIDLTELKNRIFDNFEILGLRLNNQIYSEKNYSLDIEDDWNFEKIEKEALLSTIDNEAKFKPYKKEITNLILNELKGKLTKNADYNVIKTELEDWFNLNQDILNEMLKIVKHQKASKKPKVKKTKKKKKKKKQTKQISIEEAWKEEDFSQEFGEFKELLDAEGEDFDIDSIIDDDDEDTNI
jgi:DNA repair protein SbcD/Mre11